MKSKYEPLKNYLMALNQGLWSASFEEIERILGFSLPKSAYEYREWWSNPQDGSHSYSQAWLKAGWKVENVALTDKQVNFRRTDSGIAIQSITSDSVLCADECGGSLSLSWIKIGSIVFRDNFLAFPSNIPKLPGLYRFRTSKDRRAISGYIGESSNLSRRFSQYTKPYSSQKTNIRLNNKFITALQNEEAIELSICTVNAWYITKDQKLNADFSKKYVRKLFEAFMLIYENDEAIESLNL